MGAQPFAADATALTGRRLSSNDGGQGDGIRVRQWLWFLGLEIRAIGVGEGKYQPREGGECPESQREPSRKPEYDAQIDAVLAQRTAPLLCACVCPVTLRQRNFALAGP